MKRCSFRPQWRLRTLLLVAGLLAAGLAAIVAYYDRAEIDGKVLYRAGACGMTPATIVDGKLILREANHGTPAGTAVATVQTRNNVCSIVILDCSSKAEVLGDYQIDHLGARDTSSDEAPSLSHYFLFVDNWKLRVAYCLAWTGKHLSGAG